MALEQALISSAGDDFVATLTAFLVIFVMGIFGYFVHWVTKMIPEQMQRDRDAAMQQAQKDRESITMQMQKDRDAITIQLQNDRVAICDKLSQMISEMNGTKVATVDALEKHDAQAKVILETDRRIETSLNLRPCVAQR